ncbi:MAG: glycosyltransferase family 4 protein [Candidatus Contendobacter sp.]
MATEWMSKHGGLSTLNRELCCALAKTGCRIVCVVPVTGPTEVEQARQAHVELVEARAESGADEMSGLYRKLRLPDGFFPDVVVGHGRITGPAARAQVQDSFTSAIRLHFVHMAPGEIEWFKGKDDAAAAAEKREKLERDLAQDAGIIVAIGPRLNREVGNLLAGLGHHPPIHRLEPGFTSTPKRVPPPALHCLILGRAEDLELKGLDIGTLALAQVVSCGMNFQSPPELIVRGAPCGTGTKLRNELLSLPGVGDLSIRVREYTDDAEAIESDLRRASLLLMPSRREGFGLVALEALEMGTPMLVSNKSGIGELLKESLGDSDAQQYVVDTVDDRVKAAASWAKEIEFVLRDRDAAFARARTLAERLANTLSWDSAVSLLIGAIKNVQ